MSAPRRKSINPFAGLSRPREIPSTPNDTPTKSVSERTSIVRPPDVASLPSRSASAPFDWDAVRSGKPPPYQASPLQRRSKARQSLLPQGGTPDAKRRDGTKRIVRRRSLIERILHYPSELWLDIQMLPNIISLPVERKGGRVAGILANGLHLLSRCTYCQGLRESDLGWYDMYEESISWFHWSSILGLSLTVVSFLISFYLFTRTRVYRLHHHMKPGETESTLVNSPHARFVGDTETFTTTEDPSPWLRALDFIKHLLLSCWLFLLNDDSKKPAVKPKGGKFQVQELEVWNPREAEKAFFTFYSPVHSLLWYTWNFDNWFFVMVIIVLCTFQLNLINLAYEYLIKDKSIISSEVFNEYDQKFVNPRLFPIRRDACTQTHEAEMVTYDFWNSHNGHAKVYLSQ